MHRSDMHYIDECNQHCYNKDSTPRPKYSRVFTGHEPARWSGRVGSGQELCKYHGSGWVTRVGLGHPDLTRPDPTGLDPWHASLQSKPTTSTKSLYITLFFTINSHISSRTLIAPRSTLYHSVRKYKQHSTSRFTSNGCLYLRTEWCARLG